MPVTMTTVLDRCCSALLQELEKGGVRTKSQFVRDVGVEGGPMSVPTAYKHLKELEKAKLVVSFHGHGRGGRTLIYASSKAVEESDRVWRTYLHRARETFRSLGKIASGKGSKSSKLAAGVKVMEKVNVEVQLLSWKTGGTKDELANELAQMLTTSYQAAFSRFLDALDPARSDLAKLGDEGVTVPTDVKEGRMTSVGGFASLRDGFRSGLQAAIEEDIPLKGQ